MNYMVWGLISNVLEIIIDRNKFIYNLYAYRTHFYMNFHKVLCKKCDFVNVGEETYENVFLFLL